MAYRTQRPAWVEDVWPSLWFGLRRFGSGVSAVFLSRELCSAKAAWSSRNIWFNSDPAGVIMACSQSPKIRSFKRLLPIKIPTFCHIFLSQERAGRIHRQSVFCVCPPVAAVQSRAATALISFYLIELLTCSEREGSSLRNSWWKIAISLVDTLALAARRESSDITKQVPLSWDRLEKDSRSIVESVFEVRRRRLRICQAFAVHIQGGPTAINPEEDNRREILAPR